jgi:hypothetical protein
MFENSQTEFLERIFGSAVPGAERLWIRDELEQEVTEILDHAPGYLRTRYWSNDDRSVWILDEIGKEKPITIGVVTAVKDGVSQIEEVEILAFRETRGWEVKHDFFTDQFRGVSRLIKGKRSELDRDIDGIIGATLSVRAVNKVAEVALLLDAHVRNQSH